jgi:exopolyphosphatase/guanosine-5'-triphosphate,3'-diphosphate pyrophosphatase
MIQASIDLGTNTCLLLVRDSNGAILHDESTVVRLGEGVATSGLLKEEAVLRARKCIERYIGIAAGFGVKADRIVAVGTAQARDAGNAAAFFAALKSESGVDFRILSGEEEARATFLGAALPGIPPSRMVVMDIGGGSTELVALPEGATGILGSSLGIGAVKITERFLLSDPVTDREFWAAEDAIDRELSSMAGWRSELDRKIKGDPLFVAVAGTAVTLAMLQMATPEYDRTRIDGFELKSGDVHRLVEELKWRSIEERKGMAGMEAKRADVLLAGALIFWRVMEKLRFPVVRISTRGLRYGVLDSSLA